MDTQAIWDVIFRIPVGTIVGWIIVIGSIFTAISAGTIKLYKAFEKYKELKDKNNAQEKTLIEHDKEFAQMKSLLVDIQKSLNDQKEVNLKQIRYDIVHTCDNALYEGFITAGKLKSMEELFSEYTEMFHANGYVKTLVEKTRTLPVKGKLDD